MHWRCDMGHFKKACILFIYIKTGVAFWCAQYSTTPSLAIYVNTCPISVWLLSLAVHANIARGALPGSKFFHFHAVFAKQIGKHTHFGSRRPPPRKILDRHCQPGDILCRPGSKHKRVVSECYSYLIHTAVLQYNGSCAQGSRLSLLPVALHQAAALFIVCTCVS